MINSNLMQISTKQLYLYRVIPALGLLVLSFILANAAGNFATTHVSNPVTDLFLDNLPIYDVNFIHIFVAISFWVLFALWLFNYPTFVPFVCKSAALFIFIRSGFICLTHLGVPPNQLSIPGSFSALLIFSGDMFFSGHVGGPFLLYLIFYPMKRCRRLFFAMSVFFGLSVLLGHIHYSIDVFAAPFITFTIFHMSKWIFKEDWMLLHTTMSYKMRSSSDEAPQITKIE